MAQAWGGKAAAPQTGCESEEVWEEFAFLN